MTLADAVESPCVDVCVLDEARGCCTGCFRTLEEIGAWMLYTSEQRAGILSLLERRRIEFNQSKRAQKPHPRGSHDDL